MKATRIVQDFTPTDPEFEGKARANFARHGALRLIGARLVSVAPGRVEVDVPFRDELSQQHGFFHAGISTTLADTAAGCAAFTLFPANSTVLTVEFKINLLAPADGERLRAVGQVLRRGRTLTVCEMQAWVERAGRETQCLHGIGTMMCLAGKPDA
jgi:uncharacterized protein (TIGR00369 family)